MTKGQKKTSHIVKNVPVQTFQSLSLPRLFSVNHSSGQLSIREGVPPGSYQLQVRVSDPAWPDVTSTAQVDVIELPQEALRNAASLRLRSKSTAGKALAFLLEGLLRS